MPAILLRRHNFQTISWFYDLYQRELIDMDPPYQRRSVWNIQFKEYFIDTVLMGYPAPAIFLYEEISAGGRSIYNVVDGKQRLSTIFEFIKGEFPIAEKASINKLSGLYFEQLDDSFKKAFWSYQFLVEYLPDSEEGMINDIFDRINRNVAKLTPQELRHARLDGEFITVAEQLAPWMLELLPKNVPRFDAQARKQMKDIELTALLLLLIEEGVVGYSQNDLDKAFSERDKSWERRNEVEDAFRKAVETISSLMLENKEPTDLSATRLRNQADFYSLFGAVVELGRENKIPSTDLMRNRLLDFVRLVDDSQVRETDETASRYFQAARSASNDKGPRDTRIKIIKNVVAPNEI